LSNTLKLYRHQELALNYMRLNDGFGLFMSPGTGKTINTLVRVGELIFDEKKARNCLVICPKPVIGSWWRDVPLVDLSYGYDLKNALQVVNYEQLLTKFGKNNILNRKWDIVVLDESHYIKNKGAKRTKACLELGLNADYRYILTGTPISNGQLENIYSQFTFLYPYKNKQWIHSKIFGTWSDFTNEYCFLNKWYQPYRYKNVDKLQDIISQYSYRVTKEECLDLPEKLPDEIYEIELKEKKIYKELHKHSTIEEWDLLADNGLSRMAKLRQVCSGFVNTESGLKELKTEKIKILNDFLDGFDQKLVIFCEFKYSMEQIMQLLDKRKIKYTYLNGEQKDKQVWRKFQEDDDMKVIICQYQSGNAGIDLYKANTMIFYEPTLSSNILEQARDRIHRIGTVDRPHYIFFLTKGTIEEKIYKALQGYQDFNKKLFEEYMYEYQRSYHK
jgi:SNF2 family DNA or RNA helicase